VHKLFPKLTSLEGAKPELEGKVDYGIPVNHLLLCIINDSYEDTAIT
jgi:hypothetical protein